MSVKINLSPSFHEYTQHCAVVAVEGATVRTCLSGLIALFPVFKALLFESEYSLGALVIINGEVIVMNQLDRPVADGQEIKLLPMLYGG